MRVFWFLDAVICDEVGELRGFIAGEQKLDEWVELNEDGRGLMV